MASFTSFTITQSFLGVPLQFEPALGSRELEQLIDAFVTGSASKKDKLSQVTIDFYNNATVDLNTGALVRRYDVALSPWQAFEQTPAISQSSSFNAPVFTPSPASTTFADSGYGSISMTPPVRNRSRVAKKVKKDTKKTAEARLPGFSIMTKDGVDVTSAAGRGTKTKEQREHAHLMRIMKACDDCKRKKVRCDPSHRRSQTDMYRSSSSTTKTSSSASSFSITPSPPQPSLSREATYESLPSFGTGAIDDFVLFPEDNSFWNPADASMTDFEGVDLNQFDFDISADQTFDFSFFEPAPSFQQPAYTPLSTDQFGLDQWASSYGGQSQLVTHSRPHHCAPQDTTQLEDSSWYSSGLQLESPISPELPANVSHLVRHSSFDYSANSPHANQTLSAPAPTQSQQSSMLAPTDGSSRSPLLPQGIEASSPGAIPGSVAEQHNNTPSFVLTTGDSLAGGFGDSLASGFGMKYGVLVALALSASLVILNILQVTLSPLAIVRQACTQWVDNDPLTSFAKLLLCCAVVASPSSLWKIMNGLNSFTPMAAATLLLQLSSKSSGIMSSSNLLKGIQRRDVASLFEMVNSPVQLL